MTGDGVKEFFDAVEASRGEYERCFSIHSFNEGHCVLIHIQGISSRIKARKSSA